MVTLRSAFCDEWLIYTRGQNLSDHDNRRCMRELMLHISAHRRLNGGYRTALPHPGAMKMARKVLKANLKSISNKGPLRSLNAWMGFRCYYLFLLAGLPQKFISKIMTIWWRHDLFGAKWTLLCKAYSIVRGSLPKHEAPLPEFFAICAPIVGVVPPAEYLQRNGWQLGPPEAGSQDGMPTLTRNFVPDLASFPPHFATTTLSVDDLVNECYRVGYVTTRTQVAPNATNQGELNMVSMPTVATTTTAPTTAATSNSNTNEDTQQPPLSFAASSPYWPVVNDTPTPRSVLPSAGQRVLTQASADLINAGSVYPHYDMFHPSSEMVDFDPAAADNTVADGGMWDSIDFDAFINQ